jgi:hypothetical protein
MITTVTTTTVTTVTTLTAASLALVAVLTLLVLLLNKELVSGSNNILAQRLSRALNVVVIPLLLVFGVVAVVKMLTALS